MFELEQVTYRYGDAPAVDGVSLATAPGETTVLIGPSGCGKSTIFRLMTGLLTPDAGVVRFDREPLTASRLGAIRRRIGYVIQDGGLFPHLTGRGNVALMARHLGWPAPRVRDRIDELAALTQLSPELLERYPAEMSGGQRQRVALMRALMLDPQALLLDEPLAALDPMVRAELQEELAAIFRRLHKTVVLVTHDMNEALFFGQTIVLLRAGRVIQTAPPEALLDRPAEPFVEAFVRAQRDHISKREPA